MVLHLTIVLLSSFPSLFRFSLVGRVVRLLSCTQGQRAVLCLLPRLFAFTTFVTFMFPGTRSKCPGIHGGVNCPCLVISPQGSDQGSWAAEQVARHCICKTSSVDTVVPRVPRYLAEGGILRLVSWFPVSSCWSLREGGIITRV